MSITHLKVSTVPDGADTSVVRPSDWNADHVVSIVNADVDAAAAIDESKLNLNFPTFNSALYLPLTSIPLSAANGGTGISGGASSSLTLPNVALTLAAAGAYTLTIPATGTVDLLGTAQIITATKTFTTQQIVDGTSDQIQLRVQAHSTNTARWATWERSNGYELYGIDALGFVMGSNLQASNYQNSRLVLVKSTATNFDALMYAEMTGGPAAGTTAQIQGLQFYAYSDPSAGATITDFFGGVYDVRHRTAGTTTRLTGVTSRVTVTAGAVGSAYGFRNDGFSVTGGTLTNGYGINLSTATKSGGGAITNLYGLYVNSVTAGGTLNYAIYSNLGLVRHGDGVVIDGAVDINQLKVTGHTTQSVATPLVQFTRNDAAAGVSAMLGLTALGSGAAGDGGSIPMAGKSSTTAATAMALIDWRWISATHATRAAALRLYAYDTAARLGLEIQASGTAPKLAFFGGTTAVQQVLNAYTSDGEGAAYTGIDNLQIGTVYATVADLNQLRVAYETLRASYDDLRTKLQTSTLVA